MKPKATGRTFRCAVVEHAMCSPRSAACSSTPGQNDCTRRSGYGGMYHSPSGASALVACGQCLVLVCPDEPLRCVATNHHACPSSYPQYRSSTVETSTQHQVRTVGPRHCATKPGNSPENCSPSQIPRQHQQLVAQGGRITVRTNSVMYFLRSSESACMNGPTTLARSSFLMHHAALARARTAN